MMHGGGNNGSRINMNSSSCYSPPLSWVRTYSRGGLRISNLDLRTTSLARLPRWRLRVNLNLNPNLPPRRPPLYWAAAARVLLEASARGIARRRRVWRRRLLSWNDASSRV